MRHTTAATLALIAALGASCSSKSASPPREPDPVAHTTPDAAPREELMTITSSDQIAGTEDQIVSVAGTYLVQNLGRYQIVSTLADGTELQSNKLSYLQLSDGGSVRLGARPEEELAQLTDQRVIATGRMREQWPKPDPTGRSAQPNPKPTLIEITEIRPAPGQ